MLRLRIKLQPKFWDEVVKKIDTYPVWGITYWTSNKICGYRCLWKLEFGDESFAIGLGFNEVGGKVNKSSGFVEYNPNKVQRYAKGVLDALEALHCRFEPMKYDLAIDYLIPRRCVRMVKDGRKYECVISDSITEYLGQRSKPGRVKVYDKQKEAKLNVPMTRIELTCDAAWDVAKVMAELPVVTVLSGIDVEQLSSSNILIVQLLKLRAEEQGEAIEPWLQTLDKRTRAKIRRAFASEGAVLPYDEEKIGAIIERVKNAGR